MECDEAKYKIQALIDKELPEKEIHDVLSHIESCYRCKGMYIELLRLEKKLHSVAFKEPPKEWFEKLANRKGRTWFQRFGIIVLIASNAALLIFLFLEKLSIATITEKIVYWSVFGGILVLLGISIFDRIHESKGDRYKGVIK